MRFKGLLIVWKHPKNGNVEEMAKFWNTYDFPKLSWEHINNLNRFIINNEVEAAILKKSPSKEKSQT